MKLAKKHSAVIKMLAYTGGSKRDVSQKCGISEQTLYNWLRDPDFQRAVDDYSNNFKQALKDYQDGIIDKQKFIQALGLLPGEEWILNEIVIEGINVQQRDQQTSIKERMNRIMEKCLNVVEKRLDDNTADSELLGYLMDRFNR